MKGGYDKYDNKRPYSQDRSRSSSSQMTDRRPPGRENMPSRDGPPGRDPSGRGGDRGYPPNKDSRDGGGSRSGPPPPGRNERVSRREDWENISEENILNLKENMATYKWNDLFKLNDNANSAYDKFIKVFTNMLDKCTPLKRKRKSRNKSSLPWITKDLIKMINKKKQII